jgi:hypothetical protein
MTPPESPDELAEGVGVGALAGSRASSEMDAYGGNV